MNIKKTAITAFVVMALIGSVVQPVAASGTLYVGTTSTNDAVTYSTIDNAVENASSGDTIEVASGTYNTSVEVTADNLNIIRSSSETSGTVTIDATNSKYGDAFYGDKAHNVTTGTNVALTENTVTVDANNTGTAGTYGTIQNAVDNATANSTVSIVPGEYQESVNVTTQSVAFVNNNPDNGNVTVNATQTDKGDAFYGEYDKQIRIGQNLIVEESVYGVGGGAIGSAVAFTLFGIPAWAILVVALLAGYVLYEEKA